MRLNETHRFATAALILATGFVGSIPNAALAQSDQVVTTTREKEAATPRYSAETLAKARISEEPRYYLDTIDTLQRIAPDSERRERGIPGLTKNNYLTKAFPIYNTEAIEIQSYLLRPLSYEGGIAEVFGGDGVKDELGRKVQFLYITAPDFMIPGISELVKQSDRPGFKFYDATAKDFGGGSGCIVYSGKHRTASELTAILKGTELGNIGVFLYPPFADDSTNTIYIVDNPSDSADNVAALVAFDRPPLQVELEVTVYEVSTGNGGKLGLDWDAWKSNLSGSLAYGSTSSAGPADTGSDVFTTALSLDARALAEFLNYTVQTGTSKVLTTSKLTMVNSEDQPGALVGGGARGTATGNIATVASKTVIPFTVQTQTADNGNNGINEIVDVETAFEGVEVKLLPFIGTDSITLTVDTTVNSLVGYSKSKDIPIISSRTLTSVVNIADGQVLILGGLDKTTDTKSRVGIPGLKDIPVIQYLFSKESKVKSTSKVLISLKPKMKKFDDPVALAMP